MLDHVITLFILALKCLQVDRRFSGAFPSRITKRRLDIVFSFAASSPYGYFRRSWRGKQSLRKRRTGFHLKYRSPVARRKFTLPTQNALNYLGVKNVLFACVCFFWAKARVREQLPCLRNWINDTSQHRGPWPYTVGKKRSNGSHLDVFFLGNSLAAIISFSIRRRNSFINHMYLLPFTLA